MWSLFSRDPAKDFPYEIGEVVDGFDGKSIWTLYRAKKKGTSNGDDVSVFVYDIKAGGEVQLEIARNAVKRLKTLRHPSVLTYVDSLETDKVIYLATERIEPLHSRLLRKIDIGEGRALSFLNNDGNLRHNNVNLYSVFVNEESGEWKLGCVEYMTTVDAPYMILPHELQTYSPPEVRENAKPTSVDMWGLGCLIWEAFNGPLGQRANLKSMEQIPKQLLTVYKELTSLSPDGRPNPADVIARCRSNSGFFKNDLVDALLFLEEIQMKEKGEKGRFFSQLASQLDSFPEGVGRHKILPQLLAAFEFGDAGSAVLPPLLQLGNQLPDAEYQKRVVPCVVKLFASNDRATRLRLLQQLDRFVTPKLDYNNLNVEVLRYFAKLQSSDEQGGIRTNTTVCLGKIAQHLHPQIRQKVLIGAFIRGTRDPFPPARSASVSALAITQQYYLLQEVANRILPALCTLTTDADKTVRDTAFRTIRGFLFKLEKVSEDPGLRETMEADVNTATPSLSNAAATWAGWAVTTMTAKFYRSQSDTPKSSNPHTTSRILLNKPASLEQASSSQSSASTTATTSSATSMTSLDPDHEHDSQNTANTQSDCDWDWEADNWGDMEQQPSSTTTAPASTVTPSANTSKPNDHWTSLEEEPELEAAENLADKNEGSESGWDDQEFQVLEDFQTIEQPGVTGTNNKFDEARKKREERKLARQKQMEAKRATKLRTTAPAKKV
ncbi:Similar to scyl1: N-terminal kinase-like protein (Xenopus tropicalis) [Cotesia congregata]|uniref:N-terminal kinase-like protein n=1 Tax=Cotesia congregata TaxID=51543 RepID=A0A8J2HQA5_COTCN|nr:Similar to scyl1: N-terminal kinase-like protein (Xenopus tropicalis) [Cotesia congregata]